MKPNTSDNFQKSLDHIIDENLGREHFGVSELAKATGMSRSNLHRKIKSLSSITVSQYLRQYRLKKGLEMLRQNTLTVSEVAYQTGFSSPSYFVKCFHDYFGYPPGEVGKQKNLENIEKDLKKTPKKRGNSIIILSATSAAILISIVFVFFSSRYRINEKLKKTIVVLPFIDDSPEAGNAYIINGLMDEILNKLQKVIEFDVKSRTDSEKYRNSKKNSKQIAQELNVDYIIEGSGQRIQDRIKLRIQLIEALTGNHIWSKTFTENLEDIFELQEKVALSVTSELKIELSNKEMKAVKKLPTENLEAYNLYLLGVEYQRMSNLSQKMSDFSESNKQVEQAKDLFLRAIALDSTFSEVYAWMSLYYIERKYYEWPSSEHEKQLYLDSGFYFANKALEYDDKQVLALSNLAMYYFRNGDIEKAEELWEKRDELYEGNYDFNTVQGKISESNEKQDYYSTIKYYLEYKDLKPNDYVTPLWILNTYKSALQNSGYFELSKKVLLEILTLNADTFGYLQEMVELEYNRGDFNASLEYAKEINDIDTTYTYMLMANYLILGDENTSYEYYLKNKRMEMEGKDSIHPNPIKGCVCLKNENEIEAQQHFRSNIPIYQKTIDSNLPNVKKLSSYFNLFVDYIALGEKDKALGYLKEIKNIGAIPNWIIVGLDFWPCFNEIRNHPVFIEEKNILRNKFQEQHERIGELLNDMGEFQ